MSRDILEVVNDTQRICRESWKVKLRAVKIIEDVKEIHRRLKSDLRQSRELLKKSRKLKKEIASGETQNG